MEKLTLLIAAIVCLCTSNGCSNLPRNTAPERALWPAALDTTTFCGYGKMVLGEEDAKMDAGHGWLKVTLEKGPYKWSGEIRSDVDGYMFRGQNKKATQWLYKSREAMIKARLNAEQIDVGYLFYEDSLTRYQYYFEKRFYVSGEPALGEYVLVIHPDSGIKAIQELALDSCQRVEWNDTCSRIPLKAIESLFKIYPRSSMQITGYPSRTIFTLNLLNRKLHRAHVAGQGTRISIDLESKFPGLSYAYACLEPRADSVYVYFPNATIAYDVHLNCRRVE